MRPPRPPLLLGAALSAETARWIGEWADGLITVAGPRDSMRRVIDAFRETGGDKPMFLQVTLSFAPSQQQAEAAAMEQWRQGVVGPDKLADLTAPQEFDRESAGATLDDVSRSVRISTDVQRHVAWLQQDRAMGFERIYVHNVAREHLDSFVDVWAAEVLPEFT